MKLTKQQRSGIITMLVVAMVIIIGAYLLVNTIFKLQLLMTPCELCVESQPYLKKCFGEQMYYESIVPGGINISELEVIDSGLS